VLVKVGDTLAKDQPVVELETDKATIEVPSSVVGTVKEIKVKAGDKVKVGQAILSYDEGGAAKSTEAASAKAGGEGGKPAPAKARAPAAQATVERRTPKAGSRLQCRAGQCRRRKDRRHRQPPAGGRGPGSVHQA